jgi:hypothetical protein
MVSLLTFFESSLHVGKVHAFVAPDRAISSQKQAAKTLPDLAAGQQQGFSGDEWSESLAMWPLKRKVDEGKGGSPFLCF